MVNRLISVLAIPFWALCKLSYFSLVSQRINKGPQGRSRQGYLSEFKRREEMLRNSGQLGQFGLRKPEPLAL